MKHLFEITDLCFVDFLSLLEKYNVFFINESAYVFDESFVFQILYDILTHINKGELNYNKMSIEDIFSDGLIQINERYKRLIHNLSLNEKIAIMKHICDYEEPFFSLNVDKIKLFCVKNIFSTGKDSFILNEFTSLLERTYNIVFPFEILSKMTIESEYYFTTPCDDNLLDGYKGFDLRFLKGCCIIFTMKTYRDPLIKIIDITTLSETFKIRLQELFEIKDKWTLNEIKAFFVDLKLTNIELNLLSYCRSHTENNVFDPKIKTTYFDYKFADRKNK